MLRFARLPAAVVAVALLGAPAAAAREEKDLEKLSVEHREWLEDVRWLIPRDERREFLKLDHELDRVYAAIESELRSKYLLVYQSTASGSGFREVRVETGGGGLAVKAMRGYYP